MSNRETVMLEIETLSDEAFERVAEFISFQRFLQCEFCEKPHIPNAETIAAIKEVDEMLKNGTGRSFSSVDELFEDLMS